MIKLTVSFEEPNTSKAFDHAIKMTEEKLQRELGYIPQSTIALKEIMYRDGNVKAYYFFFEIRVFLEPDPQ